jgi:hypothetical protein
MNCTNNTEAKIFVEVAHQRHRHHSATTPTSLKMRPKRRPHRSDTVKLFGSAGAWKIFYFVLYGCIDAITPY